MNILAAHIAVRLTVCLTAGRLYNLYRSRFRDGFDDFEAVMIFQGLLRFWERGKQNKVHGGGGGIKKFLS